VFILRDYQEEALRVAEECFAGTLAKCLVAPTGSGKGVIEAALLRRNESLLLTTPNQAIATGIAEKLTGDMGLSQLSDARQQRACEKLRIFTDRRALNEASRGSLSWVRALFRDEAHHGTNDTHESLGDLLPVPHAGATATPYRGTPKGTAALTRLYPGGLVPVLTLKRSVAEGFVSLPQFRTLPLLDDEQVDVVNGEFVVRSVESAIKSRVGQLTAILKETFDERSGLFRRPATVVLGSVGAVSLVAEACDAAGVPTVAVLADTKNRTERFREAVARRAILLQIRAVGEGVDLPLRVMYDLAPTMSPVLWMQRVGRIMRPLWCLTCGAQLRNRSQNCCETPIFDDSPTYFACCHNLMRHGYLFEGLIPKASFVEARQVWGDDWQPSRRTMTRALGNTGFGRFAPTEVRLRDGGAAWLYALRSEDGLHSYAALLLPQVPTPFYFMRQDVLTGATKTMRTPSGVEVEYAEKKQGRWTATPALPDATGLASYPADQVFPWMLERWRERAERRGLDASVVPTRKQYQLFRILEDTSKAVA